MRSAVLLSAALLALTTVAAAAPVPRVPREGVIALTTRGPKGGPCIVMLKDDGTLVAEFKVGEKFGHANAPRVSPDGLRVAAVVTPPFQQWNKQCGFAPTRVAVFDVAKPETPLIETEGAVGLGIAWSGGTTLYFSELDPNKVDELVPVGAFVPSVVSAINVETGKRDRVPALDGHTVVALSADGETVLTYRLRDTGLGGYEFTAHLVALSSGKVREVAPTPMRPVGLSPDGKSVLGLKPTDPPTPGGIGDLFVIELATGLKTELKFGDDTHTVNEARFSPDGKRLLVRRTVERPGLPPHIPGTPAQPPPPALPPGVKRRYFTQVVEIRKADGSDPKVVYELKPGESIAGCDWR